MSGELTDAQKVRRLADIAEIENLIGRYQYLHVAGLDEETAGLFAQQTPGVKLELPTIGIYDGIDSVRRFYVRAGKFVHGDRRGHLHLHTLTTPVIEVAGDGRTAQGVWLSPGVETSPERALWAWLKYGIDFVREPGGWRIWHFCVYRIFFCPPGSSWAQAPPSGAPALPDEIKPDRPASGDYHYSPKRATEHVPAVPEPYEVWEEDRAYVR
jgi:hypothetical protein